MARDLIKSDLIIKASQPQDKPYRLNDGKGLILLINPNGTKYWRLNYAFQSKRKTISLGVYPNISLKQARGVAQSCRQQISEGVDPSQARKQKKQVVQKALEDQQKIAGSFEIQVGKQLEFIFEKSNLPVSK